MVFHESSARSYYWQELCGPFWLIVPIPWYSVFPSGVTVFQDDNTPFYMSFGLSRTVLWVTSPLAITVTRSQYYWPFMVYFGEKGACSLSTVIITWTWLYCWNHSGPVIYPFWEDCKLFWMPIVLLHHMRHDNMFIFMCFHIFVQPLCIYTYLYKTKKNCRLI